MLSFMKRNSLQHFFQLSHLDGDSPAFNSPSPDHSTSRASLLSETKSTKDPPSWNEFTQSTTIHGVRYIFDNRSPYKSRRSVFSSCRGAMWSHPQKIVEVDNLLRISWHWFPMVNSSWFLWNRSVHATQVLPGWLSCKWYQGPCKTEMVPLYNDQYWFLQ